MIIQLVQDLARLKTLGARKVLCLAMENPGRTDVVRALCTEKFEDAEGLVMPLFDAFSEVLVSIHRLRAGEVAGTGSNHCHAQLCAYRYFAAQENAGVSPEQVLFSKFDANTLVAGPLLEEMESVFCFHCKGREARNGSSFMPVVCWSAVCEDKSRSWLERAVALSMVSTATLLPFSISWVGGSLGGICEAGHTCPSLLPEDELSFFVRVGMLPKARNFRLSSSVVKIFFPGDLGR